MNGSRMNEIYLDNSATTPLSDTVKAAMREAMEVYGNPSSLHMLGKNAHDLLEKARRDIAATLGARGRLENGQLIFTSCGSEADNLAILGTAYAKPRRKGINPFTKEEQVFAAKPASVKVKVRPLKKLKDAAA